MKTLVISMSEAQIKKLEGVTEAVEIRRRKPAIDVPFKCYIYEAQINSRKDRPKKFDPIGRGKIVGECVCEKVDTHNIDENTTMEDIKKRYGIGDDEAVAFEKKGAEQRVCVWFLKEIRFFKKPKKLSDYNISNPPKNWCYCYK